MHGKPRMVNDDRRLERNNGEGRHIDVEDEKKTQACNRGDIEVTREGEETSLLDLKSRGDDKENQASDRGKTEANREGEDPELGLGIRRNVEVTREGEENPKLDLRNYRGNTEVREGGDPELDLGIRRNHEDIEATRCKTPVTTKEEENPGKGGDTKEDEGSREEEEFLSALTGDS